MRYRKVTNSADVMRSYVADLPPKEFKAISPSSLGGCDRVHFWKLKGVQATTPPNYGALVNFQIGFLWEELMAKAYESQGKLVKWFKDGEQEPFYDEESGIGGTPDFIIEENGEQIIVDAKTVNSKWFHYVKNKSAEDWAKDNQGYIYQQVAYIYLARKAGYDINRAILSFASKDDGYIGMEFELEVSDEAIEKVLSRAKRLKRYLDSNELPPCTCEGWQVGYCGYGNPATRELNKTKKEVNSECCDPAFLVKVKE
jgi:CRISPR/Cas system-associated exonuclease Cas4 (RecB family)